MGVLLGPPWPLCSPLVLGRGGPTLGRRDFTMASLIWGYECRPESIFLQHSCIPQLVQGGDLLLKLPMQQQLKKTLGTHYLAGQGSTPWMHLGSMVLVGPFHLSGCSVIFFYPIYQSLLHLDQLVVLPNSNPTSVSQTLFPPQWYIPATVLGSTEWSQQHP